MTQEYTNNFLQAYNLALQEKILETERATGSGGASDWGDYKDRVGRAKGLKDALRLFSDTAKRYIDEDDIEDG